MRHNCQRPTKEGIKNTLVKVYQIRNESNKEEQTNYPSGKLGYLSSIKDEANLPEHLLAMRSMSALGETKATLR